MTSISTTTNTQPTTSLVDLHVEYLRPHYRNLPHWREDSQNLYIGRPGVDNIQGKTLQREGSPWQNPFKVGKDGDITSRLIQYKAHITKLLDAGEVDLEELRGKRLGCWCVKTGKGAEICHDVNLPFDQYVCHGQVLMQLIYEKDQAQSSVKSSVSSVANSQSTPVVGLTTTAPVSAAPKSEDFPTLSSNPKKKQTNTTPVHGSSNLSAAFSTCSINNSAAATSSNTVAPPAPSTTSATGISDKDFPSLGGPSKRVQTTQSITGATKATVAGVKTTNWTAAASNVPATPSTTVSLFDFIGATGGRKKK